MAYFSVSTLVGTINSAEALSSYLRMMQWCRDNIATNRWYLDYTTTVCLYDTAVPIGIVIYDINTAIDFCRS